LVAELSHNFKKRQAIACRFLYQKTTLFSLLYLPLERSALKKRKIFLKNLKNPKKMRQYY